MNWNDELLKRGFIILESTTRLYGYGDEKCGFTGSILYENSKGNIIDDAGKDVKEIFCPFIHDEEEKGVGILKGEYQSIRLRNMDDLEKFMIQNKSRYTRPDEIAKKHLKYPTIVGTQGGCSVEIMRFFALGIERKYFSAPRKDCRDSPTRLAERRNDFFSEIFLLFLQAVPVYLSPPWSRRKHWVYIGASSLADCGWWITGKRPDDVGRAWRPDQFPPSYVARKRG